MSTEERSEALEKLIATGDLSRLSPEERVRYYFEVCRSLGLNPYTNPLKYITLQGRLTLYASRDACDQLRKLHRISIDVRSRDFVNGLYVVTVRAETPDGRHHESIGAVPIEGLKGEQLANALMKAETKASRRATLAICGLGFLDETEVDSLRAIGAATPPSLPSGEGESVEVKVEVEPSIEDNLQSMNRAELLDTLHMCMEMIPEETEAGKKAAFAKWLKDECGEAVKLKELSDDRLRELARKALEKWASNLVG